MNTGGEPLPDSFDNEIDALRRTYEIDDADLARVREFGSQVDMTEFISPLYDWMRQLPEYEEFFSDRNRLTRVQGLQVSYWEKFFEAELDAEYLASRRLVGEIHARIGLPLSAYLATMNKSMDLMVHELYSGETESTARYRSVTKLASLDTAIIAETFTRLTGEQLSHQSDALIKMSTPVSEIWEDVLMLPLVGVVDSKRAQDILESMLVRISTSQARYFILDVSGVAVVDTAVANHLIKITKATQLMGCECTISGLSPAIAQTIVELGINVNEIRTTGNLRAALKYTLAALGVEIR